MATHAVMASITATEGIGYGALQSRITLLERETMRMKEEVYLNTSLSTLASRAAQMGFVHEKRVLTISSPLPIAYSR
jgi:hypothetical protein